MFRKYLREFFLLPRWEQRAMLLLSLLLLLAMGVRFIFPHLLQRQDPGVEEFMILAREIMDGTVEEDSLEADRDPLQRTADSHGDAVQVRQTVHPGYSHFMPSRPIDLNAADSAALLPLPGIGPVLAGRIVRFRELLGGYHHTGQLAEVYGLKPETLSLISEQLWIDTSRLIRLQVNAASFRDLLRHPYLEYEDVLALVRYRETMGPLSSLQEIREQGLLADSVRERIAPYLDFSNKRP
jgi:hypothetical protein